MLLGWTRFHWVFLGSFEPNNDLVPSWTELFCSFLLFQERFLHTRFSFRKKKVRFFFCFTKPASHFRAIPHLIGVSYRVFCLSLFLPSFLSFYLSLFTLFLTWPGLRESAPASRLPRRAHREIRSNSVQTAPINNNNIVLLLLLLLLLLQKFCRRRERARNRNPSTKTSEREDVNEKRTTSTKTKNKKKGNNSFNRGTHKDAAVCCGPSTWSATEVTSSTRATFWQFLYRILFVCVCVSFVVSFFFWLLFFFWPSSFLSWHLSWDDFISFRRLFFFSPESSRGPLSFRLPFFWVSLVFYWVFFTGVS